MPTPLWTRIVIGLAAVLWFLGALLLDAPLDAAWAKPAGAVIALVVLLLLAFDRWAWRWLPAGLTKRPNLRGTWKGELHYEWPPGTPGVKDCFFTVRQTYSDIEVDMHFDISSSESRSAELIHRNGRYSLWWSYLSIADTQHQSNNPPHRGGAEVNVTLEPKVSFAGNYWTERKTTGRLVAHGRSKKLYGSYEAAAQGEYKAG
jgi:hypothetical protein